MTDFKARHAIRKFLDISNWNMPFAATLTLKQGRSFIDRSGCPRASWSGNEPSFVMISPEAASRNFRHFRNVLDRTVYGHAATRYEKRVRVIPVLEGGSVTRFHYHAAIDCPAHMDPAAFATLIKQTWTATDWGHREIAIKAGADQGWIGYITKFRTKQEFDLSIDWMNFHNP